MLIGGHGEFPLCGVLTSTTKTFSFLTHSKCHSKSTKSQAPLVIHYKASQLQCVVISWHFVPVSQETKSYASQRPLPSEMFVDVGRCRRWHFSSRYESPNSGCGLVCRPLLRTHYQNLITGCGLRRHMWSVGARTSQKGVTVMHRRAKMWKISKPWFGGI